LGASSSIDLQEQQNALVHRDDNYDDVDYVVVVAAVMNMEGDTDGAAAAEE
jgi:hypothetical protein